MPIKIKNVDTNEKFYRDVEIRKSDIDDEARTVNLAFSSEEGVQRYFGVEVLDHSKKSVRLDRMKKGGPLLVDHNSRDHIGVVEKVSVDSDRVGRAVVRFGKSERAEEIFQDVMDGIRKSVSVGYRIYKTREEGDVQNPTIRITDWEPLEISIVSVPADASVGVGRSEDLAPIEEESQRTEDEMPEKIKDVKIEVPTIPEVRTVEIDNSAETLIAERSRVKEIQALGSQLNKSEDASRAIESGMSVDDFRKNLLKDMGAKEIVDTNPDIGLTEREIEDFSFTRAMSSLGQHGDFRSAEYEGEVSRAVETLMRTPRKSPGFFVPQEVMRSKMAMPGSRDLVSNIDTAGGYLVGEQQMSFIDLLRNSQMVIAMGAQVFDGLVGNVTFPKQSGGGTAYWLNEGEAPAESQQIIGQVGMTPKTIGAYTDISRRLLLQGSIDVEAFVRRDLATILALAMDQAAIDGTGVDGQPKGILTHTGIGDVAGGTNGLDPTWAHAVSLETDVAVANALIGNLGYLSNSKVIGKYKTTEKASNTGLFVIDGKNDFQGFNTLNGFKIGMSNQVPSNLVKGSSGAVCSANIFGNWSDLMIGYWGALDVQVDPYTGGLSGTVRIRLLRDVDVRLRREESFSAQKDILTA